MTLVVHGVTVPFGRDDVSPIIWDELSHGTYEEKEVRWLRTVVRPHDRVLELGSGVGITTAVIAGIPDVHVWAYEASPSSFALAQQVMVANALENVTLSQGILSAGAPQDLEFYVRRDLWMSSLIEAQGPYEATIKITSSNIDQVIDEHRIDIVVMDIEGAEVDLLVGAELRGVHRVFLELHDHLYGLQGIRKITDALGSKGFGYDPRGSSGSCVLFSRCDRPREYDPGRTEVQATTWTSATGQPL